MPSRLALGLSRAQNSTHGSQTKDPFRYLKAYIVDYFDNECGGSECFAPELVSFLRSEGVGFATDAEHRLVGVSRRQCHHLCQANQNGEGARFPCKVSDT